MPPLLLAVALSLLPPALAPAAPGAGGTLAALPAATLEAPDPLRVYRVRAAVDLPLTAVAAATAAFPYTIASQIISPRCPCDRREVPRTDRFAIGLHSDGAGVASDVVVALAVAAPLAGDALRLGWTPAFRADLVVFAETLAVNSALVVLAKYAAQRPLPRTYEGDPALVSSARGYRSFYSGHTSTAVSALTAAAWTLHLRDGPAVWPWLATAAAGVGVGVLRVAAGRHFPSDVAMGALAGFAVGTAVPLVHARRLWIVPAPGGVGVGRAF